MVSTAKIWLRITTKMSCLVSSHETNLQSRVFCFLIFRCQNVSGNVLINKKDRNMKTFCHMSRYIMQQVKIVPKNLPNCRRIYHQLNNFLRFDLGYSTRRFDRERSNDVCGWFEIRLRRLNERTENWGRGRNSSSLTSDENNGNGLRFAVRWREKEIVDRARAA